MAYGQHVGVGESTDHCRQAVKALDQVESTSDVGSAQPVQHGDCTLCELGHCGIAGSDATSLSMVASRAWTSAIGASASMAEEDWFRNRVAQADRDIDSISR